MPGWLLRVDVDPIRAAKVAAVQLPAIARLSGADSVCSAHALHILPALVPCHKHCAMEPFVDLQCHDPLHCVHP